MKNTLYILALILMADCAGFICWVASNQQPMDGFFIGTLTANFLKLWI